MPDNPYVSNGEFTILFVADVVGHPGREAVKALLPGLRKELNPDLAVVNGTLVLGTDLNAGTATAWAALSGYNQLYYNSNTAGVNYFAAGEITNTTGNNATAGTHAAGPQSYRAAEGIKKYLANVGMPGGVNYLAS